MKKSNLYVLGSIEAIIGSIIICITSIIKELIFPETILRMIFNKKTPNGSCQSSHGHKDNRKSQHNDSSPEETTSGTCIANSHRSFAKQGLRKPNSRTRKQTQ